MITIENFGPNNRDRCIGRSLYRICMDEATKQWYIYESYNADGSWATGKAFHSHDLGYVIDVMNRFTEEREIISRKALKNGERNLLNRKEENMGIQKEENQKTAAAENKGSGNAKTPVKPKTVSQELFKQLIFDTLMESQDQVSEDVTKAILDILDRYDVGSPWRSMDDGKPASGKYFFIKLKKSAGYTDSCWQEPLLAIRMKGGFHIAGRPFSDMEVEAYSEVRISR